MAFFNFGIFGEQEHRVFNYKPRYYDPEKEAVKQKFAGVDGTTEKEDYVPGTYLKGAFRRENRYRTASNRARTFVTLAGLLMVIVILIYVAKLYPILTKSIADQQATKEDMYKSVEDPDPDEYRVINTNDFYK